MELETMVKSLTQIYNIFYELDEKEKSNVNMRSLHRIYMLGDIFSILYYSCKTYIYTDLCGQILRFGKGTGQLLVVTNAIPFLKSVKHISLLLKFGSDCTLKPFSRRHLTWKKNQTSQAPEKKIL